jgi:iron-chelate-transporting ATPase
MFIAPVQSAVADNPQFDLKDVSFAIPERTLLEPLTLALPGRRVTGLIGHNGSGKSTLIKLLARQQPASTGEVLFSGKRLSGWGDRAFAQKVAYLPQQPPPTSGMLVKELVALGRYPWHGALDTLSGGERQRVWLAMLVAQDTQFLLLDEPISALDVAHQVEVLSLVQRLSRERGLGVVVVLHDVNMASRFCDEIIALKAGRMVARGAPDQVMTPDELQSIYSIAMDVFRHPATGHPVSFVR